MEKRDKKIELLAPAGNKDAFMGAVHAGADAIYLGGEKFGARAYAENFSREELTACIRYGHIHGCRSYLTVNTLMKEQELPELVEELIPLYEAGLDGVIVQDLGALREIRQHFPGLALHASTQMTVTGGEGAKLLRELGVTRVVPARELNLKEIRQLKRESGLEVETFIHGAMCYCYSGACLFSSVLGGRSGNRGRCAQPCRLAYETDSPGGAVHKKEYYPLSLKDMCTIEHLPRLIESGIDSLKIEGRMKKPEYAAGVTAIYRRYIDRYMEHPQEAYEVEKQDLEALSGLYIRSKRQDGYYFRQNGREMVTLDSPSYSGCDEAYLRKIRQDYIEEKKRLPVWIRATFICGQNAQLQMGRGTCQVTISGGMVEPAQSRPIAKEDIRKQLQKLGETCFFPESLEIRTDERGFYSLKEMNTLRREAVRQLEDRIIEENGFAAKRSFMREKFCRQTEDSGFELLQSGIMEGREKQDGTDRGIRLQVSTGEQLIYLSRYLQKRGNGSGGKRVERLYVESCLFAEEAAGNVKDRMEAAGNVKDRMEAAGSVKDRMAAAEKVREAGIEVWMALPYILRSKDFPLMQRAWELYRQNVIRGFLVRNLEEYGWLRGRAQAAADHSSAAKEQDGEKMLQGRLQLDHTVYVWNSPAAALWQNRGCGLTLPLELSGRECRQLLEQICLGQKEECPEKLVYGRIPMMVTANCIARTAGKCLRGQARRSEGMLTDRYRKKFPVEICCDVCLNVIYNSVPLSLHKEWERYSMAHKRLSFTTESGKQLERILDFFMDCAGGKQDKPPYEDYTTGHEKKGVL